MPESQNIKPCLQYVDFDKLSPRGALVKAVEVVELVETIETSLPMVVELVETTDEQ